MAKFNPYLRYDEAHKERRRREARSAEAREGNARRLRRTFAALRARFCEYLSHIERQEGRFVFEEEEIEGGIDAAKGCFRCFRRKDGEVFYAVPEYVVYAGEAAAAYRIGEIEAVSDGRGRGFFLLSSAKGGEAAAFVDAETFRSEFSPLPLFEGDHAPLRRGGADERRIVEAIGLDGAGARDVSAALAYREAVSREEGRAATLFDDFSGRKAREALIAYAKGAPLLPPPSLRGFFETTRRFFVETAGEEEALLEMYMEHIEACPSASFIFGLRYGADGRFVEAARRVAALYRVVEAAGELAATDPDMADEEELDLLVYAYISALNAYLHTFPPAGREAAYHALTAALSQTPAPLIAGGKVIRRSVALAKDFPDAFEAMREKGGELIEAILEKDRKAMRYGHKKVRKIKRKPKR